jgi:hypothetical protein
MAEEIAVLIKTYMRENTFFHCTKSIIRYMIKNNLHFTLYIADDGDISEKKKKLYNKLHSKGHTVLEIPLNTGASKSRNMLLARLKDERYILRMDDDFEFNELTNLKTMLKIVKQNRNIGIVADLEKQIGFGKSTFNNTISPYQGFLEMKDGVLYKRILPLSGFEYVKVNEIKYAYCDFSRNMLLIRREVFDSIKWDNNIFFNGEHEDLMLQLKHHTTWRLVFTTESVHLHREDIPENNTHQKKKYYQIKKSINDKNYFYKKWGIRKEIIKRPLTVLLAAGFLYILRNIRGFLGICFNIE